MRTIIKVLGVFLFVFSGVQTINNEFHLVPKADSAGQFLNSLGEDDPILMHGHVRTGSGGAIAGATVSLYAAGTSTLVSSATSNGSGDYTINPVASGSYDVEVRQSSYYTKTYPLTITATITRTDTLLPRP